MTKLTNLKKNQIIEKLSVHNTKNYNLLKASEECQELALILLQKLTKPARVNDQQIINEIGDVIVRIKVLKRFYSKKKINQRVNDKLSNLDTYIKTKRYRNI